MITTKNAKTALVATVMLFCLICFPILSYASYNPDSDNAAVSAEAEISGQHIVENNTSLRTGRHTFVLTADRNGYPMPEGSADGKKEITVSSNESFSFGNIHYVKEGLYSYKVTRDLSQSNDLMEDASEYKIKIAVFNDGKKAVMIEKDGMDGKQEKVEYKDRYIKKGCGEAGKKIETGDDANMLFATLIMIVSLLCFLIFTTHKNRDDDNA